MVCQDSDLIISNEQTKEGKRKFWHSQNSLQHKFQNFFPGIALCCHTISSPNPINVLGAYSGA